MQRSLHTLKGSARLSGLAPIGDLSHAFESLLTAITHGDAKVADDTLELAQRTLDTLSGQIDAVEGRANLRRTDDLVQALALALEEGLAGSTEMTPQVPVMAPSPAVAEGPPGAGIPRQIPAPEETAASALASASEAVVAPQIRVRSDLIDRLVNNAGEISIYRSRLAQQGGLMAFRLGEFERTVDRLREQLRQLEMETEAQILHRYERDSDAVAPAQDGFDPLELDRFSTLQQRSRSLAETVNDLVSLRTLLRDLQSESDTLLLQQARISNDLQDGLLRMRMVPFVQIVPRLHRVVRQTAQQLGKKARLEVYGPEVELDRSIQERILAPLEHLLRNAVAHGIELPEQRVRAGKPSSGVISLVLNREGNDVVITVADDGAGLDLEAIRKRALDKGLITESAEPGEEELTGLILESGFSTADRVSQIAGRGVGLDVVNTEVKQLSGTFTLQTHPGHGTSFSIRLPLTLAIIDALLVQLGDQVFAIPHATIEAVSRISRADLEACFEGRGEDFSYGGHEFPVMYLGSMLQLSGIPELGERRWLPVLLVRSGEQRVAFHVEQLIGSQRIVVKPLGPELSTVRWLSGGTILADGRVAMILDLLTLLRSAAIKEYRLPVQPQPQERKQRPCILVVDDSLTVRRVTSRMLQRQNMDVITATDGIDALTRLEERVPDVVLLDIEMPRMDGYELTRHIRRSERLKEIPLIMITSRTGEKHRRHAMELGVDRYLGKPYQETDLLDEISSVLVEASL
jgi:chemosensory pili system protein ChpA (sensor histidine kinase/response regulator)